MHEPKLSAGVLRAHSEAREWCYLMMQATTMRLAKR